MNNKIFSGIIVTCSEKEREGHPLYCEEMHLIVSRSLEEAKKEYHNRILSVAHTYIAGNPPQEVRISLLKSSDLLELEMSDKNPLLLISREFDDMALYKSATTV